MMADNLLSTLTFIEYNVSLSNNPQYTTSCVVNDVRLELFFGYNPRTKERCVIIEDLSANVYLTQTLLKVGRRCELNTLAQINNLDYYVTLKPRKVSVDYSEYDYLNWSEDFTLCFMGQSQVQKELLETNYRKVVVGN